ncbi:MAG: NADH:ubiquinone oxidoreductase subunit C [Sulfurimonas sp.]|jgi:NADH:ubiquinone oxidoreductase subunit C
MKSDILEEINNKISTFCINKIDVKEQSQELFFKLRCSEDIINIAKIIKEFNGRCITIDIYKNHDDNVLLYHFDIKNILITIETTLKNKTIISLSNVLKSTVWIERELSQQYSINFSGHSNMKKVFLDKSMSKTVLNEYLTLSEIMTNKDLKG